MNASSKQRKDCVSVVCRKGSLLRQKSIYSSQFYELKVKWTKKLTYFFLSLYLHQTLKRTILSEIWVNIFLPKPLQKDKRSKSEHFRRLHENVSEMAARWTGDYVTSISFGQLETSGRKNVLRKLLRIPYRRLKAGFSVCWLCLWLFTLSNGCSWKASLWWDRRHICNRSMVNHRLATKLALGSMFSYRKFTSSVSAGIVGFLMTSLKFKLKNSRSYRDFTFTMH